MLRNAREHATDPAVRSASAFADGNGRARPVHRAQVGRWERGAVGLTHDLVRRYETVLGLPDGQLLTVIDIFSRARHPVRTAATLSPDGEPDVDLTLGLVESALGDDRLTGRDWDRMSDNIGRMPHVILRAEDWAALVQRCLREADVSIGLDWAMRTEAMARLAGHPRSGSAVARLVTDLMGDPTVQLYTETVGLLQFTSHPEAIEVLLGQLREPTSDHTLRAALIALTAQVRGGQLDEAATLEAARLALALLRERDPSLRIQRCIANLLATLDERTRHQLAQGLSTENHKVAASVLLHGRALSADAGRSLQRRVRNDLVDSLHDSLHDSMTDEPVLERLLDEALGFANEENRGNALAVLMLSPQGRAVGRAVGRELTEALRAGDEVAAHECLAILSYLGQPEDLDTVTAIAVHPGAPPDRALEAAVVVGNCPDVDEASGLVRVERIRARVAELVAGRAPAEPTLRGLTYVLGMRGRFDVIAELAAGLGPATTAGYAAGLAPAAERARAAAGATFGWWLDLPEHLRPVAHPEVAAAG